LRGFCQQTRAESSGKTDGEMPPWLQKEAAEASEGAGKEAAAEEQELSPVERLQNELEELRKKSGLKKKDLLLALADFENKKKQTMKERETRRRYATANFARRMVEVYSEFEDLPAFNSKAVEGKEEGSPVAALQEGVVLTSKLFASAMEKSNVETLFVEVGTPVVNARHEVVGSAPGNGSFPDGSIAEVTEAGWIMDLNGKSPQVLRKAKVKTVG